MPPCSCLVILFLLIPHHTIPPVGLDVEGVYRVSGKTNDILRIKKQFDNGKPSLLGCTKSVEGFSPSPLWPHTVMSSLPVIFVAG